MIKSSPQEDHRRRHGLALPQRAQARAENLRIRSRAFSREGEANADHPEPPPFHGQRCSCRRRQASSALDPALAEPPPETATARFVDFPGGVCIAPQYIAEGLLRGEGFTDFRSYQRVRRQRGSTDREEPSGFRARFRECARRCRGYRSTRSRVCAAFMLGAGSCLPTRVSTAFVTLRARVLGLGPHLDQTPICSLARWPPMWASTQCTISTGLSATSPRSSSLLSTRSMPSWASR